MGIYNLTIGKLKELKSVIIGGCEKSSIFSDAVGKYAIVRSRNEGLNFGLIDAADETGCIISKCRRIWWHRPTDPKKSWHECVSKLGLSHDSKVSCAVEKKIIAEDYSITFCSEEAIKSIKEHPEHEG